MFLELVVLELVVSGAVWVEHVWTQARDSGNIVGNVGGGEPGHGFQGTVHVPGNEADLSDSFEEMHNKWNSCLCYFIKVVGIESVSKLKKQIPIF